MIKMTIDVKAYPEKLKEFLQTLDSLMAELRKEKGNLSYEYMQKNHENKSFHIQAEWQNWTNLEDHFRGDFFAVLMGAIRVLCEEPKLEIDDGSRIVHMGIIDNERNTEALSNE